MVNWSLFVFPDLQNLSVEKKMQYLVMKYLVIYFISFYAFFKNCFLYQPWKNALLPQDPYVWDFYNIFPYGRKHVMMVLRSQKPP